MVSWDLSWFQKHTITFGLNDKKEILNQLATGNRMILLLGLRGIDFCFTCYLRKIDNVFYIWVSNDERRRIIQKLKKD